MNVYRKDDSHGGIRQRANRKSFYYSVFQILKPFYSAQCYVVVENPTLANSPSANGAERPSIVVKE